MKRLSMFFAAGLAAAALAVGGIKIEPKFEAGQKSKMKTSFKVKVGDVQAELSGTLIMTVKAIDGDAVKQTFDWEDPKAVMNGEEAEVPFAPTDATVNKAGEVQEVTGGIQGTDPARTFLLGFAHLPTTELEKDGKWSAKYPKNDKMELGERTVEGTYLGEEEVGGKKAHKFNTVMKEGGLSVTMTYWATLDGKVLKFNSEFTGYPVPVAGGEGSGTLTGEVTE